MADTDANRALSIAVVFGISLVFAPWVAGDGHSEYLVSVETLPSDIESMTTPIKEGVTGSVDSGYLRWNGR